MNNLFALAGLLAAVSLGSAPGPRAQDDAVVVGLNYPKTGPHSAQGLDQWRAAHLALEEINAAGGVLGKPVRLEWRDSESRSDRTRQNVAELIDEHGARMVFGGACSGVAIAAGEVCGEGQVPFFGTLTYSNAATGKQGHPFVFRECSNAWAASKALGSYLREHFAGERFLYVTADYAWGHATEQALRAGTDTPEAEGHDRILTPFPGADDQELAGAIELARQADPDVLVLVLFGTDLERALGHAKAAGLGSRMQLVAPSLTLTLAERANARVMEGVVGTLPWCWQVPYEHGHVAGMAFVERFAARYERYPDTSAASAYTILHQWREACERAHSFNGPAVVRALEGHAYTSLKGPQRWRAFDHQSVQSVYVVRCKPAAEVLGDRFGLDYFELLAEVPGEAAFRTRDEWNAVRIAAGKPVELWPPRERAAH